MPAPVVVYYVAAVGTVVAVMAFKQLVYDPHIAPTFDAWRQAVSDNRRNRTRREMEPLVTERSVPESSEQPGASGRPNLDHRSSDDNDSGVSVEMEDLVATETAGWQSSRIHSGLRHRNVKHSDVLDESNVFVPYDPISPTQLTPTDTSVPPSPASTRTLRLSTPPVIHSPLPRTPIRAQTLQSAAETEQTSSRLSTPTVRSRMPSPRIDSPATRSSSSNSSFTPAVIGPESPRYGSPRAGSEGSDGGRSTTYDVVSPPGSRMFSPSGRTTQPQNYSPITSPFSDIQHPISPQLLRSPSPVLLSPGMESSLHLRSEDESDLAILSPSLRSGMFSPGFDFDNHFEITSDIDEEMSDWESFGRRTPSP